MGGGALYAPPPDGVILRTLFSARVNPRPAGGQFLPPPPLSNIRDNLKTTQDIATKLSVPYWTSIWHFVCKFCQITLEKFEKMTFKWCHVMRFRVKNGRQLYRSQINVYRSKSQSKDVKTKEIEFSTGWLSRIVKIFGFWPPKFQKLLFSGKSALKSKISQTFKKTYYMYRIYIRVFSTPNFTFVSQFLTPLPQKKHCNKCEMWLRHKNESHFLAIYRHRTKNRLHHCIPELKLNQKSVFYFQNFQLWTLTLFYPFWPDLQVKS